MPWVLRCRRAAFDERGPRMYRPIPGMFQAPNFWPVVPHGLADQHFCVARNPENSFLQLGLPHSSPDPIWRSEN